MAIDKAVDSAVLDSTLTAIADAIREKAGTTDPIAFDAMAAAIAAIEAGGSIEVEYGTFTLSEEVAKHTVTFGNTHSSPYDLLICMNLSDNSTSIGSVGFIYTRNVSDSYVTYKAYLYSRQYNTDYFPKLTAMSSSNDYANVKWEHNWIMTGEFNRYYAVGVPYLWIAIWGITI